MGFKTGVCRSQRTFLPMAIDEYLPDNHLAKLLWTMVNFLNLDKIINKYSNLGQRGFDPKILTVILFYGYAIGIRSSRKLAQSCVDRLDFMYLTAKLQPSYKVISEFRRENLEELQEIFQEIILIGIKLGLVKIGNIKVSIDGTKIRANASGKVSKDESGLEKLLAEVDKQVTAIMKEAEETDKKEDLENGNKQGGEIPIELEKLEVRKAKIEKALGELTAEKASLKKEIIEKKSKNGKEGVLSKKEEEKIENIKINLTDFDAKYMKEREGCIKTNYNAQGSVDEKSQFILANAVTDECNDKKQLISMIELTETNIDGKVNQVKTDSGYHSADNLANVSEKEVEAYIDDPNKQRVGNENYRYDKVNFKYDFAIDSYICPEGNKLDMVSNKGDEKVYSCKACGDCPAKESCVKSGKSRSIIRGKNEAFVEANREKMLSAEGKKEYQKRMHTVEPVFGNIKYNLGFRQFLLRGLDKVKGEFNLMCIAHNVKKIASHCMKNEIDLKVCLA